MNRSHPALARMFVSLSAAVCLLLVFTGSPLAAEYVSINNNGVNVRSGPSTEEQVRWEVFKDFPIQVLKRENDWAYCLDFEGDKGWIYGSLLSDKKTVIVKKDKVNLRDAPDTGDNAQVVALVKYGVVFDFLAKDGEWLKVKHNDGTEGWIHQDMVWPGDPLD
ncbi:MAG: SH3 domain-containing protein [Desulfobulbales bacterium]|nr:SH3 domain-containing protein [Desulfobulbales bacterium]